MAAADEIKAAMERKGLRQADLVRMGIGTRGRVSDLVNGKRPPSKLQALKLADCLRISLRRLISKEG